MEDVIKLSGKVSIVIRKPSTGVYNGKRDNNQREGVQRGAFPTGAGESVLSTLSTPPTTITIPYKYYKYT
jgi:hypothetical protein